MSKYWLFMRIVNTDIMRVEQYRKCNSNEG